MDYAHAAYPIASKRNVASNRYGMSKHPSARPGGRLLWERYTGHYKLTLRNSLNPKITNQSLHLGVIRCLPHCSAFYDHSESGSC